MKTIYIVFLVGIVSSSTAFAGKPARCADGSISDRCRTLASQSRNLDAKAADPGMSYVAPAGESSGRRRGLVKPIPTFQERENDRIQRSSAQKSK